MCWPAVGIWFIGVEAEWIRVWRKKEFFFIFRIITEKKGYAPTAAFVDAPGSPLVHPMWHIFGGECGKIFHNVKKKCDAKCQAVTPPNMIIGASWEHTLAKMTWKCEDVIPIFRSIYKRDNIRENKGLHPCDFISLLNIPFVHWNCRTPPKKCAEEIFLRCRSYQPCSSLNHICSPFDLNFALLKLSISLSSNPQFRAFPR